MAAIEILFVPVVIYNSNGTKHDAAALKEFNEPAWNNPVVRIIDSEKKDIIDRINGVYSAAGIGKQLIAALDKAEVALAAEPRAVLQKVADGKAPSAEEIQAFKDALSGTLSRKLDKSLDSAVAAWGEGKFGRAAELAAKARDDEKAGEAVKADAEYLLGLVTGRFDGFKAQAEKLKGEREYLALFALVDEAEVQFTGCNGATELFAGLTELKRDKAVKEELKALEKLAKLEEKLTQAKDGREIEAARKELEKFADKNEGTRAAEKARELLAS